MGKESLPTQLILKWKRKKQKKCYIFFPFCGKLMKEKNLFWYIAKPNTFIQESITLYCFSFFGEGSVTLQKQKRTAIRLVQIHMSDKHGKYRYACVTYMVKI